MSSPLLPKKVEEERTTLNLYPRTSFGPKNLFITVVAGCAGAALFYFAPPIGISYYCAPIIAGFTFSGLAAIGCMMHNLANNKMADNMARILERKANRKLLTQEQMAEESVKRQIPSPELAKLLATEQELKYRNFFADDVNFKHVAPSNKQSALKSSTTENKANSKSSASASSQKTVTLCSQVNERSRAYTEYKAKAKHKPKAKSVENPKEIPDEEGICYLVEDTDSQTEIVTTARRASIKADGLPKWPPIIYSKEEVNSMWTRLEITSNFEDQGTPIVQDPKMKVGL